MLSALLRSTDPFVYVFYNLLRLRMSVEAMKRSIVLVHYCIDCPANQRYFVTSSADVIIMPAIFLSPFFAAKDALAIPTEPIVIATSTAGDIGDIVTEAVGPLDSSVLLVSIHARSTQ